MFTQRLWTCFKRLFEGFSHLVLDIDFVTVKITNCTLSGPYLPIKLFSIRHSISCKNSNIFSSLAQIQIPKFSQTNKKKTT